jgi:hypothetical protein
MDLPIRSRVAWQETVRSAFYGNAASLCIDDAKQKNTQFQLVFPILTMPVSFRPE